MGEILFQSDDPSKSYHGNRRPGGHTDRFLECTHLLSAQKTFVIK